MSIRTKLLAVGLLPLIATTVLAGMIFAAQSVKAGSASESARLFEQRATLIDAAMAIGAERMDTARGLDEVDSPTVVDDALVAQPDFSLDAKSSISRASAYVSEARSATGEEWWKSYDAAVADLLDAAAAMEVEFPTISAADNNDAVEGIVEVIDSSDRAWVFFAQLGEAAVQPQDLTRAASLFGLAEDARSDVRYAGSGEISETIVTTLRLTEPMSDYKRTATESLYSTNQRFVTPPEGLAAASDYRDRWILAYERSSASLGFEISNIQSQARRYQLLAALAGLTALALIGFLGLVVQRSISTPLQALLDGTDRLTGESMPEMIKAMREVESGDAVPAPELLEKRSDDEIGDLVGSFNDLGRIAHRLAAEQVSIRQNASGTLFAYGERQARLLDRLLLGLNELEIDELNIALLAKLGEMDHLASTIRRNAQSMVVLGGDYTERPWASPVAAERVARAATANMEAYDRVNISNLVPAYIKGAAGADVQHILAELLENSVKNSDKLSRVVLEGFWSAERYVFIVSDEGHGLSAAEISVSNSRIRSAPRLDTGPVTKLGLSVVGLLAARHKIEVSLTPKDIGINAIVTLPSGIVSHTDELQVPTSLGGGPTPRTQRDQAQLPIFTSDTMPPGALKGGLAKDGAGEKATDVAPETPVVAEKSEDSAETTTEDNPEPGKLDYEVVAIPPAFESSGFYDSPHQLASSEDSERFSGAVNNKMAAAIEALTSQVT